MELGTKDKASRNPGVSFWFEAVRMEKQKKCDLNIVVKKDSGGDSKS